MKSQSAPTEPTERPRAVGIWDHCEDWLRADKSCAVCVSIDDVHAGTSKDPYEGGGDLESGVLGRVKRLLKEDDNVQLTLFVTPDWRMISPIPTDSWHAANQLSRERLYPSRVHKRGTLSLLKHPALVAYAKSLPRTEIALHGLHHIRKGRQHPAEFAGISKRDCTTKLVEALRIMSSAGISDVVGLCPPRWDASEALVAAAREVSLLYVASARDIVTPIAREAVTNMSGARGASLLRPCRWRSNGMMQIPTNFQATSQRERAFRILELGGLLSIKAHAVSDLQGHIMLDALNESYVDTLLELFRTIKDRFGTSIWWTNMRGISQPISEGVIE